MSVKMTAPWEKRAHDGGRTAGQSIVRLEGVHKRYKDTVAVDEVNLQIGRGEFFTLLGPSGSGKTTTLRMIAGFERPDRGRIELDGADITRLPPYERDINTVFQDYALFPHMTVAKNLAYGLEAKRVPKREAAARIGEALRMVRLEAFAERQPSQLSGGQRQRVALARAIVNRPRVLLLDEPLGALDLKLRQHMQVELKRIQEEVQITFIYVTHDQEEALTMSDLIAVFNHGRIEQVADPVELYERPATEFVADFLGTSNLIEDQGGRAMIRPEKIRLLAPDEKLDSRTWVVRSAVIRERTFMGQFTRYLVGLEDGTELLVVEQNTDVFAASGLKQRGAHVSAAWRVDSVYNIPGQVGGHSS